MFGEHDLGARAPFPRIDLILCRNVLIYFTPPMQRAALETFGFSLRDGGRLVLGPSETVAAMPGLYEEDHGRLRIYRRVPGGLRCPCLCASGPAAPGASAPARRRHPVDPPGRPGGGRLERRCREAAARAEPRGRGRGRSLLHHPHQHGGSPDARDPWTGVRPGLHPSRGVAAVDRDPDRDRCGIRWEDDDGRVRGRRDGCLGEGRPFHRDGDPALWRQGGARRRRGHRAHRRQPGGTDRQTSAEVERRLDRAALSTGGCSVPTKS